MVKPNDPNQYQGCGVSSTMNTTDVKRLHKFIDDSLQCTDSETGDTEIYVIRVKKSLYKNYIQGRSISITPNEASENLRTLCDCLQDKLYGHSPVANTMQVLNKAMELIHDNVYVMDLDNATYKCKYCERSRDIGHSKNCGYVELCNLKKALDLEIGAVS